MKLGFTGTRKGLSLPQERSLRYLFDELGFPEIHHGDCRGADTDAHRMACSYGMDIVIHPPIDPKHRTFCEGADQVRTPFSYMVRNRNIVIETDHLVACPDSAEERLRSGTWATIRYARKVGKRLTIIFPDGTYVEENL